jgi:hypothetical protein
LQFGGLCGAGFKLHGTSVFGSGKGIAPLSGAG